MAGRARGKSGVDPTDAVPLYHQIYLSLRDAILSGELAFGAPLPTEAELAARHGVSRITARRALDELALLGLVERRRRTGTRVIFREPTRPLEGSIEQAVETLIAFGRKTRVQVREIIKEPAAPDIARDLCLSEGDTVVRIVRIRFLDGKPLGRVVAHAPGRLGAILTRKRLDVAPVLEILRASGHAIGIARQAISAELADADLAAALDVEPRSPVLCIRRVVADLSGAPLLCTTARYRGDRYRITLDLQGGIGNDMK